MYHIPSVVYTREQNMQDVGLGSDIDMTHVFLAKQFTVSRLHACVERAFRSGLYLQPAQRKEETKQVVAVTT